MGHLRDVVFPMYQERDSSVRFLAVSIYESPGAVQNWLDNNPMPFDVVLDQYGDVYPLFATGGFPFNAIIDDEFILRHKSIGYNAEMLTDWLDLLLDEAPATESSWSELRSIY